MEPSWHQKSIKNNFLAARTDSRDSQTLLDLPEAAKSSKNLFSVGFKEPERGVRPKDQGDGEVASKSMSPPQKRHFFKDKTINHQPELEY